MAGSAGSPPPGPSPCLPVGTTSIVDCSDYLGLAWYQTTFDLPWGWEGRKICFRFGSVNYLASPGSTASLPAATRAAICPSSLMSRRSCGSSRTGWSCASTAALAPDRVPPGNVPPDPNDVFANQNYPAASFDFFPYCGIHRPVWLTARHPDGIDDLTDHDRHRRRPRRGCRRTLAWRDGRLRALPRERSWYAGKRRSPQSPAAGLRRPWPIPSAMLWEPGAPNSVHPCGRSPPGLEQPIDQYALPIGIRTIAVEGDQLLLNGKPVVLKGFGRHEDFPIVGRGLLPAGHRQGLCAARVDRRQLVSHEPLPLLRGDAHAGRSPGLPRHRRNTGRGPVLRRRGAGAAPGALPPVHARADRARPQPPQRDHVEPGQRTPLPAGREQALLCRAVPTGQIAGHDPRPSPSSATSV